MSEIDRITDQLRRSYAGEAWHGPALAEVISDLTPEQATARPLPGVHSVAEIVRHAATWAAVARRRLEGERVESVPAEEDWPAAAGASRRAWRESRATLEREQERLLAALGRFPEERLDERIPEAPYSYYFLLHGIAQHHLYHAGQIVALRRALGLAASAPRAASPEAPAGGGA